MRQRILSTSLVLLLAGCSQTESGLTLENVRADEVSRVAASHKDSAAVLVNFWATWCQPCVEEFPMIVQLGKQYASKGLVVYFVSVDWLDERDRVVDFLSAHGVTGVSFIKNQDDNDFINGTHPEWTGAVPFTLVYSKKSGEVIDFWESKKPRERFISAIETALGEQNGGSS